MVLFVNRWLIWRVLRTRCQVRSSRPEVVVESSGLLIRWFRHSKKARTNIRKNRTPGRPTRISIQMSQRRRSGTGDEKESQTRKASE